MPPLLSDDAVRQWIAQRVPQADFRGRRVLMIVPDATRTAPLPLLFDALSRLLLPVAAKLDVLVALGTHPAMSEEAIARLLGISADDRAGRLADVGLFNHEWDNPARLLTLGHLSR